MTAILLVIHILVGFSLIGLVLVQQGKGATMGAAFGSGASQTIFGSRGSGSFLMRVTMGFAVLFFSTSIALNYLATVQSRQARVLSPLEQLQNSERPMPVIPTRVPSDTAQVPVSNK